MRTVLLLLPFLLLFVFNASAVELTGFGSAYYLYQKDRAPMEYYKKGDIHKYSKVGVNMTGLITKNASAHLQLVASGDDSDNDSAWQLKSDFAFISIAMASKYSLKIGRQAFPIWLFSGYRDIGVELPFSRQPAITTAVSSFKSFNGGSFVTDIYTGSDCKLALKVFAGEEKSNALTVATSVSSSQYGSTSIQFKNIYGVNANFEHDKVNLNMSLYTLDIYVATQSGPTPPGYQSAPLASMGVEKADIGSFGASYSGERLLAIFEHGYFRFKTANQGKLELHGGYGLLGLHLGDFMPRYSLGWSSEKRSGGSYHTSLLHTVGVNYDYAQGVVFKMDIERGTLHEITQTSKLTLFLAGVDFAF